MKKGKRPILSLFLITLCVFVGIAVLGCSKQKETLPEYEAVGYIKPDVFVSPDLNRIDELGGYPSVNNVIQAESENQELIELIYKESAAFMEKEALLSNIANGTLVKHPHADTMYGKVDDNAKRIKKEINIGKSEYGAIFTGLYAAPGEIITLTFPLELINNCEVVIAPGVSDIPPPALNTETGNYEGRNLNRMPQIKLSLDAETEEVKIGTPFGGIIQIYVKGNNGGFNKTPRDSDSKVIISGAVETPYYILGKTTKSQWDIIKNYGGKAVNFVTDNLSVYFWNRENLGGIENPKEILTYYKSVLAFQDSLTAKNLTRNRKMVLYFDDYVAAGWAYATVPLDYCNFPQNYIENFLDYEYTVKNGAWGVFHEMGHQHQANALSGWNSQGAINNPFTLAGDGEVAVNIFSILCTLEYTTRTNYRLEKDLSGHERISSYYGAIKEAQTIDNAVLDYAGFTANQRLSMFSILINRFGAKGIRNLLSSYLNDEIIIKDDNLSDEQKKQALETEKRDQLLIRSSKIFGYDMRQFFEYFKFNNTVAARNEVDRMNLKVFYPVASLYAGTKLLITGKNAELDFKANTVSLYGEIELKKLKLRGKKNNWKKINEFSYQVNMTYKAKQIKTPDSFYLDVKTPSETVRLSGKLSSITDETALNKYFKTYDFPVFSGGNIKNVRKAYEEFGNPYISVVPVSKILAIIISVSAGFGLTIIFLIIFGIHYIKKQKNKAKTKQIKKTTIAQKKTERNKNNG